MERQANNMEQQPPAARPAGSNVRRIGSRPTSREISPGVRLGIAQLRAALASRDDNEAGRNLRERAGFNARNLQAFHRTEHPTTGGGTLTVYPRPGPALRGTNNNIGGGRWGEQGRLARENALRSSRAALAPRRHSTNEYLLVPRESPEQRRNTVGENLGRARVVALARQERLRSCHLLLSSWDSTALDARRSGDGDVAPSSAPVSPSMDAHDSHRQLTDVALAPPPAAAAVTTAVAAAAATSAAAVEEVEAGESVEVAEEAVSPRSKEVSLPEATTGWKTIAITLVLCVICFFAGYWLRFRIDNGTACVEQGRENNVDIVSARERVAEPSEYDTKISARRSHPAVHDVG